MSETLASALVILAESYAAVGLVFAIAMISGGLRRIDPLGGHGSWGFKLLVIPGLLAFWPLMLRRWAAGRGAPPTERNAHRDATRQGGTS